MIRKSIVLVMIMVTVTMIMMIMILTMTMTPKTTPSCVMKVLKAMVAIQVLAAAISERGETSSGVN